MPEISDDLLDQIIDKLNEVGDEWPTFSGDCVPGDLRASEELCKLRSTLESIRDAK